MDSNLNLPNPQNNNHREICFHKHLIISDLFFQNFHGVLINKLNQYNLIDSIPSFAFAELINDDAKKGVDYFFCKKNLKKYKKVKTTKVLGRYAPPKMNCK